MTANLLSMFLQFSRGFKMDKHCYVSFVLDLWGLTGLSFLCVIPQAPHEPNLSPHSCHHLRPASWVYESELKIKTGHKQSVTCVTYFPGWFGNYFKKCGLENIWYIFFSLKNLEQKMWNKLVGETAWFFWGVHLYPSSQEQAPQCAERVQWLCPAPGHRSTRSAQRSILLRRCCLFSLHVTIDVAGDNL